MLAVPLTWLSVFPRYCVRETQPYYGPCASLPHFPLFLGHTTHTRVRTCSLKCLRASHLECFINEAQFALQREAQQHVVNAALAVFVASCSHVKVWSELPRKQHVPAVAFLLTFVQEQHVEDLALAIMRNLQQRQGLVVSLAAVQRWLCT